MRSKSFTLRPSLVAGIVLLACVGILFAQTAAVAPDETAIKGALMKIVDILLKYVVPGLCLLIIIREAVKFANDDPMALGRAIKAMCGLILALGAKAIISYVTGTSF